MYKGCESGIEPILRDIRELDGVSDVFICGDEIHLIWLIIGGYKVENNTFIYR